MGDIVFEHQADVESRMGNTKHRVYQNTSQRS